MKIKITFFLLLLTSIAGHSLTSAQTPSPTCPPLPTNTGTVVASVTLDTSTNYAIWSRILAPDSTNNSYYLQIDNLCAIKVGDSAIPTNQWTWVNYHDGSASSLINLQLSAGDHVVKLIGNEASVGVDKLVFLKDPNCVPTGLGDNCTATPTATSVPLTPTNTLMPSLSPTATPIVPTATPTPTKVLTPTPSDTTAPIVSITSPSNGSYVARKAQVTVTANAVDASGISKVEFVINDKLTCTDTTSTYNCSFRTGAQKGSAYTVTAKAYDKYNNAASTTIRVTAQ